MAPATAEIGDAQDLELDGGSQNSMTLAEAAIPAPIPGAVSTIVDLMIAAGRDRGEEEMVINRAATSPTPLISYISESPHDCQDCGQKICCRPAAQFFINRCRYDKSDEFRSQTNEPFYFKRD